MAQGLQILLMCNRPHTKKDAATIIDHIDSFVNYSQHSVYLLSNILHFSKQLNLNKFDVLVVHYSLTLLGNFYLSDNIKKKISEFKGLKVVFIQDEYRRVNAIHKEINTLGFDILYTCVPNSEIEKVYPTAVFSSLRKINTLTGYVPEDLILRVTPLMNDRPIEVGYRARKVPFWLGFLGAEKFQIADKFYDYGKAYKIKMDISYKEKSRYYGMRWINFIASCRTMLGVESGASIFDFTGAIERKVEKYQIFNPKASFEEIHSLFLKKHEGKIVLNQISPRCFEAIALKTVLILYEGSYSGILKPWRHYIPLKKDFSNIKKVVNIIKSVNTLQKIADCAYQEIALNPDYSYKEFIRSFDTIVSNEFTIRNKNRVDLQYSRANFQKAINKVNLIAFFYKKILICRRILFKFVPDRLKPTIRSLYFYFLDKKNI